MSKKLYWAIDINNPASWEIILDDEVDLSDIHNKVDNIKELVHIKEIEDIETIYNSLEYVEAILEDRVPIYK